MSCELTAADGMKQPLFFAPGTAQLLAWWVQVRLHFLVPYRCDIIAESNYSVELSAANNFSDIYEVQDAAMLKVYFTWTKRVLNAEKSEHP